MAKDKILLAIQTTLTKLQSVKWRAERITESEGGARKTPKTNRIIGWKRAYITDDVLMTAISKRVKADTDRRQRFPFLATTKAVCIQPFNQRVR